MSSGRFPPNAVGSPLTQRTERGLVSSDTVFEDVLLDKSKCHDEHLCQVQGDGRPLWGLDVRLLTVVEVARILGIGRSKVYELLYSGELKSVKIGASRRVRYSDLRDYVRYLDDES